MERFVIELFVRGIVLCLLTAMALLLLRQTAAAYRHLICVLALCGLLMLPLAQRLMPPLLLQTPPPASLPDHERIPTQQTGPLAAKDSETETSSLEDRFTHRSVPAKTSPLLPQDPSAVRRYTVPERTIPVQERARKEVAVVFTIWGAGAAVLLLRLMAALLRLGRLETESRAAMLGSVPVRISERIATPLTWGVRRHIILMPAALVSGDAAVCHSALCHEQAHIARRDWVWNLLAEAVCALCWYHPGVWWLRRRMRQESERACDDRALLSGIAAPDYAAHLVEILRSVGIHEIAPAMAQSGRMEERMAYILDAYKPRRASRMGLAVAATFGFALLTLAALRVAARPAAAKPLTDGASTTLKFRRTDMASRPADSAPPMVNLPDPDLQPLSVNRTLPGVKFGAPLTSALPGTAQPARSAPAGAPPLPGPVIPLDRVVWGEAADGLEPGFLLTNPRPPNERAPFNSQVSYQVLVRNTTKRDREFVMMCLNHDDIDVPYLIPSDNIVEALDAREIPARYRALSAVSNLGGWILYPAYVARLAPGEAAVVPSALGLYVGDAEKQSLPRIEEIKQGMNWIVQPVTIYSPTAADVKEAEAAGKKINMTIASRDGRTSTRSVSQIPGHMGGKRLYAKIQIEVGTLDAEAVRNAGKTVWGKVDKGIQCGIRLLNPRQGFQVGDTLEADILWRCVGDSRVTNVLPRQLDLYPMIHDAKGRELLIDFGARFRLLPGSHTFEPGEIHSLGVSAIKLVPKGTPAPKSNAEPGQITLEPGVYKLSGSGGVSAAGAGNPKSGEIEFRVVGETAEPSKEEGVSWGEKASGFQLGARIVPDRSVFKVGDTIKFQTFGRNLSGKDIDLTIGNYWKVNYTIQVQTLEGKPIYMERDGRNQAKIIAGYLGGSLGNGATQEISEARLKIARAPQSTDPQTVGDADAWVETVPLKPGRYRVRIVSWGVFRPRQPEPASDWIPIEIKAR